MKYDTVEAHAQYRFLHALREALRRRSSDGIFVLLADDCALESEYYSAHKHGKAEVEAFLEQSLRERWITSDLLSYDLAEIRESPDAPDVLFGVQIHCGGSDSYHYSVLITAEIDSQGMAKQLRIEDAGTCMIRLFEHVFCLTSEKDRDPELLVPFLLPGVYWDYLRFGLACACKSRILPRTCFLKEQLEEALSCWLELYLAKSYDIAFEELCGVDYCSGHYDRPDAARLLGRRGKQMWDRRLESFSILEALLTWAEPCSDRDRLLLLLPPDDRRILSLTGGFI